jgi:hypothetical protein
MKISSTLAVIFVLTFIRYLYPLRKELFREGNLFAFFAAVTFLFGALASLFFYCLIDVFLPGCNGVEQIGGSIIMGVLIIALLDIMETSSEETVLEYFWNRYGSTRQKWFLLGLTVALSFPCIGVFTIQSNFWYGIIWFYGITFITLLIVWLEAAIDFLVDSTRVDEV